MSIFHVLTALHVLSVVVWLGYVPAELILRRGVNENKGKACLKDMISVYLKVVNIAGMIGMTGILITGILLVTVFSPRPDYGLFVFSANHWLASKQVIMVILMILVFALIIPKAKKVRVSSESGNLDESSLKSLQNSITIVNLLVLLNFLFAFSRRFF